MIASEALKAPPCNHTTCTNRNTARTANVAWMLSAPNAATYRRGRISKTVGTPNLRRRRFVTNIDVTTAAALERPKKTPKNPANRSGEGYLAVAARENGRYSEKKTMIRTSSRRPPSIASAWRT